MSLVEQTLKKMRAEAAQLRPLGSSNGVPAVSRAPGDSGLYVAESGADRPVVRNERVIPINRESLRSQQLFPPAAQEHQLSQQYRQIKRPIIANAFGRGTPRLPNGNFVMLASALPGEGKTFTSINLAFSIAREKDVRVLLVDADAPKPHTSRVFGLGDEPGLLDALRDPTLDVESLVLSTDLPNLSILPAGRRSDNATELFASARMEEILRSLGARDPLRMVLLDSAPLMLTTESQALAQAVGQVVLVVRADSTPQQVVLDVLRYLEGRPTSLVLNQSTALAQAGYYYYGYGDAREGSDG